MRMKNNKAMRQAVNEIVRRKLYNDQLYGDLYEEADEKKLHLKTDDRYPEFVSTCQKALYNFENPGPLVMKAAYQFIDHWSDRGVKRAITMVTHMDVIDPHYVYENPYLKYIQITETSIGDVTFEKSSYDQYTCISDREMMEDEYSAVPHFGLLEDRLSVPVIINGDRTICVTPYELNSYREDIEKMSGDVAVIGLNLGYFVYMIHLKNEVTHVTVIEKQQEYIDYFYKYLLPQFDHPEKITVIHGSYQDHLDVAADQYYLDDLGGREKRLASYMAMKAFEGKTGKPVYYYNENSCLDDLKVQLMLRIMTPDFVEWMKDADYQKMIQENHLDSVQTDRFFDALHISSPAKLRNLMHRTGLRNAVNHFNHVR